MCECGRPVFIKKAGKCQRCYHRDYQRTYARKYRGMSQSILVGYDQAHVRVKSIRGSAGDYECVQCGGGAVDWALYRYESVRVVRGERVQNGGRRQCVWSTNPLDYQPMCRSCHKRYDLGSAPRPVAMAKPAPSGFIPPAGW